MERSLRQNKYYKLISNTLLFGIGTFGSKLLVFLLMPLYTSVLSEGEDVYKRQGYHGDLRPL